MKDLVNLSKQEDLFFLEVKYMVDLLILGIMVLMVLYWKKYVKYLIKKNLYKKDDMILLDSSILLNPKV